MHLILGSCAFSLLAFFAALLLFFLSFSYSQLHVFAEASVSCLLILDIPRAAVTQKETSSMWLTVRAGKREGGGMRGCVCRPFNVMKETHTHWGTYDIDKAAGPWCSYTFSFHYLPLFPSLSHPLYLFLCLSPSCFVSAKFRNKEKFAVAIFCILKCGLYSYVCVHWIFTCKPKMQRWPAATPASALLPYPLPPPHLLLTFPLQPFFFLLPSLAHCSAKASPKGSPKSF